MSHPLISHSEDLTRLSDDGYALAIREGTLIVEDIPYESAGSIKRGAFVCGIEDDTNRTLPPGDHTIWWSGDEPNASLMGLPKSPVCSRDEQMIAGVQVRFQLSIKKRSPDGTWENYVDYFDKISTYADFLTRSAKAIDASATARSNRVISFEESESVFTYRDGTAGVRGIDLINKKVEHEIVAIVGTGGTGSYILDFVARTPVAEIHLFDDDILKAHNGYRYPSAVPKEDIQERLHKAKFLSDKYSKFRRGIFPHIEPVFEQLPKSLLSATFVFLAIDSPRDKRGIVSSLLRLKMPFVHVGIGINIRRPTPHDSLFQALAAVTLMAPEDDWNLDLAAKYIGFSDPEEQGIYSSNAQIVELNALNAALAVLQWKKYRGVYVSGKEIDTSYDTELHLLAKRTATER